MLAYCGASFRLPITQAKINVKRPKLIVWPIVLIVACEAGAVGAYFGGNVQEQRLMQFPNLNFAAMNKKLKPGHAFLSAHEGDETDAVVVPLHS